MPVNEEKIGILKKYDFLFQEDSLGKLHKNPIIFSRKKLRVEMEKIYNAHTKQIVKKKSMKGCNLGTTIKHIYLVNERKNKALDFSIRMIYSAEKYKSMLPEAECFLRFLLSEHKEKLLFYLLLRQKYKLSERIGFLDHLNGNTSFDSFSISFAKAKRLLIDVANNDVILEKKLMELLSEKFKKDQAIQYYKFLVTFSKIQTNFADFNGVDELVKTHFGKRNIVRKNRFDEEKHESENPFESKQKTLELIEQNENQSLTDQMKSTQKISKKSLSRSVKRKKSPNSQIKIKRMKSRSASKKPYGKEDTQNLKPLKRKFSNKSVTVKKNALDEMISNLNEEVKQRAQKGRTSLIIKVEKILDNFVENREIRIIGRIDEDIKQKSEKIVNRFVEKFEVSDYEVDEFGVNLGYTIYAKAQLAMAFVITKERKKFFNLMRKNLTKKNFSANESLIFHWERLLTLYKSIEDDNQVYVSCKKIVIELFKFPVFKTEIVFILKYFLKVSKLRSPIIVVA